jgi:hypothetical protein
MIKSDPFSLEQGTNHLTRRYLRARKFNPQEALKQFKDTEDWRKDNKLDELYDTIDIQEYEESRRLVCSSQLSTSDLS